jgi:2'-5' RNA ligase
MTHFAGSEVIRASVWIRPLGPARDKLAELMRLVQERCGGPQFQPHLTLLEGIESTRAEADARLKRLAAKVKPFDLELGDVGWRDEYYRSLYVNVLLCRELEDAQALAHEIFEMNPAPPYEPHVSLHYGEIEPETKRLLAAEIGLVDATFTADSIHLVNAAHGIPIAEWRTMSERSLVVPRQKRAGPEARSAR